ncbi:uncharacterized protein K452DRAFT_2706 [Aplosporella prunicola CBS 121167]|uniref:Uncharacterized protein n=1 Tax=Aplosporella prunicola CBS 121167 TaxID=1176127 RepID=A0A6A6BTM4_9PEZI|nr:uncharacterized protein K452DRAFT_2706 [Aplosporella prunicola CBS 121167]KAF2147158.1 hypothetical protein K452DRAFT_2706 [Aplosporella prunicola CBS 121167]
MILARLRPGFAFLLSRFGHTQTFQASAVRSACAALSKRQFHLICFFLAIFPFNAVTPWSPMTPAARHGCTRFIATKVRRNRTGWLAAAGR